jgi:CubicO group peptidase (beta-lactamase class C family)
MRRGLLVAAIVGSIALGSLIVVLGLRPPSGPGAGTAFASPSSSPSASVLAAPSLPVVPPSVPPVWAGPRPTKLYVAALQARLDELRETNAIPGVSASIVFEDGSSWAGVSGLADVAAKRPVTSNTAFAAASISKTFIAALILDLDAEGHLRLGEAASKYLPGQKILDGVTIRMLLDHTSGLHDYFLNPKIDRALRADPALVWSTSKTLAYVGKRYFLPGRGWHYSNTNYLVLGLIAERVAGRPLAEQLRERYFEPLGLDTAYYQVSERPPGPTAHGYRFAGLKRILPPIDLADGTGAMPFRSVVTAAGGAGSVAASSLDIARWARALYGGRVLDSGGLGLMLGGFDRIAGYDPSILYSLGVQKLEVNGKRTFGHSGRFLGFRSVVRYLPTADLAIAVMTNQSRVDPGIIAADLLQILLPPPSTCACALRS